MAIPATITHDYTAEEYLALERQAEYKSEYIDGQIVAMSGGSFAHSVIAVNLGGTLLNLLHRTPCYVVNSDMRVRVDPRLYTYPDATVICDEPELEDAEQDTLLNPTVIFEVLSPSTEAYDRGEKFRRYQRIPSLRQYVLVSQNQPTIEVFTRQGDFWTYRQATGLDASIHLESVDCTLALGEVYARVRLVPEDEPESPDVAAGTVG
jgi:Uma2 family endonuclease